MARETKSGSHRRLELIGDCGAPVELPIVQANGFPSSYCHAASELAPLQRIRLARRYPQGIKRAEPLSMPTQPAVERPRSRYSISLRGMILLVLFLGIWMGWTINRAESRRRAVATLKKNGAIILYDYESMRGIKTPTATQWVPEWLRSRLGDDYFHTVTYANLTPAAGQKYQLTDHDLAPLQALDGLEWLFMGDTPITDAGLAHLEGLTNLRTLILINFDAVKGKMHLTDSGMVHLKRLTRLERLDLVDADITDAGLEHLGRMTELQFLGLRGTKITGAGLAHLSRMTHLNSLMLGRTPLTDAGLTHLRGMVSLQDLRISGTRTTDAGLTNLAGLTSLRRLDLGPENSSDAGLAHLAGLTNIQELQIAGPRVTDAGIAHLARFKDLKVLYTYDCRVSDIGLVHLSGLTKLTNLSFTGATRVTDTGLAQLRGMTQLRELMADSTSVSDEGLASLRTTLPTLSRTTNRKPKPE